MQFPVHNVEGQVVEQVQIEDSVFAQPFNEGLVHQAMVRQLANARQGTADTKTRGLVSGSTRKLYRQKHTGRARRGSIRSPLLRGGGIVFGPHPRSYRQRMPRKMRRLALKCVLSAKASSGEMVVIDRFQMSQPKAMEMGRILKALGVDSSILIATLGPESDVILSARNLAGTKTLPAGLLNVVDVLSYKFLVITVEGLRHLEKLLMGGRTDTQVG